MKISQDAHRARPWRVHELAPDFPLHDVWRFDIEGADDEFDRFVELLERLLASETPSRSSAAGWLFRLRSAMRFLDEDPGLTRVRERVGGTQEPGSGPFEVVYREANECLYEICNRTVHALLHLGWVSAENGYAPEMAVYVKPQGWLGRIYMALIDPFRHWIVYPSIMRQIRRAWATR